MKSLKLFAWIITCAILAGMISNCAGLNADVAPSTKDEDTLPTPDVVTSPAEDGSLTVYQNEELGIQFAFPSDWQGPDVYEYETGFRLEIGTDVVYPYGTSREDQVYTQPDAYYIVIQLDRPTGMDSEPAFEALQGLADGESFATPRSLSIRERALEIGPFSGVEFIATLPEGAQTECVYLRQVTLYNEANDRLSVTGQPNNVQVDDPAAWRDAYRLVDERYQDVFRQILDSLVLD